AGRVKPQTAGAWSRRPPSIADPEPPMNPKTVMTPDDEPMIVISRTVAAPRQLVFRCYTDPVHLVHFWGPHGSRMPVCELDLRPGGIWRQVLQFAEGAPFRVTYVFLEIAPPER